MDNGLFLPPKKRYTLYIRKKNINTYQSDNCVPELIKSEEQQKSGYVQKVVQKPHVITHTETEKQKDQISTITKYEEYQMTILEAAYLASNNPSVQIQNFLAELTGLTMDKIRKWFNHKNNKLRTYRNIKNKCSQKPISPIHKKNKQSRKHFNDKQLLALNSLYKLTHYPSTDEKRELANKINLTIRQVQVWFQNKRASEKHKISNC